MDDEAKAIELEFDGEMLVAKLNMTAYRKIYSLEGWLRRICLAAWMARFGAGWTSELEPKLRSILDARVRSNRKRLYLGAESHDDLIWQATHAELLRMLVADKVADPIETMTGANAEFLQGKLQEVREIRNLLAHNRAISERTYIILSGLLASLDEAVDTFKVTVLYRSPEILHEDDGAMGARLGRLLKNNDWSRFQAFVARQDYFLQYVNLPADFEARKPWPDAQLLLRSFRDHLDDIVAFCLNKSGHEFSLLTPQVLSEEAQGVLCDKFAQNPSVWTSTEFELQNPRYICSPKIWFYENESPLYLNEVISQK